MLLRAAVLGAVVGAMLGGASCLSRVSALAPDARLVRLDAGPDRWGIRTAAVADGGPPGYMILCRVSCPEPCAADGDGWVSNPRGCPPPGPEFCWGSCRDYTSQVGSSE